MTMRSLMMWAIPTLLAGCHAADAVGNGAAESAEDSAGDPSSALGGASDQASHASVADVSTERITLVPSEDLPQSETAWKERLTPEQFYVLRKHGTERAYSGEYAESRTKGTYHCAGCGEPLFDSETKFDSGTGWPSFYDVVGDVGEHVATQEDRSWFAIRTEVHCRHCGGHLGHVFDDGPAPTGLRYCINSVSLKLGQPQPLPADDASPQAAQESDSNE